MIKFLKRFTALPKRKKSACISAAAGLLAVLLLVGIVGARYLYKKEYRGSIKSREFYFTSDLLDGQTHTLAPGSNSISFTVGNHADALRYSGVDVNYTVTVAEIEAQGENLTGTLTAGSVQDAAVTLKDLAPGTYTVTARGENGYYHTISATIIVPPSENYLYKYLDTTNSEYVVLTVWSKGAVGDVKITPPAGVIPDNTDAIMTAASTGAAFTDTVNFNTDGYCSHSYRFFGSGVTAENFAVSCGSINAEIKAPN